MNSFEIASIPTEIAESVRRTGKTPKYGFPAHKEVATGRAPCRHCLRLIRPNEEELILFTYDPFEVLGMPPLPGPVYVHAESCERRVGASSIPDENRGRLLTFAAYGEDGELVKETRLTSGNEDQAAEKFSRIPR